jgi:nucleoid DNA-binding protein
MCGTGKSGEGDWSEEGIPPTFRVSKRAARTGVNPRNPNEKIKIPAMKVANVKAGKALKEAVR